MTTIEKACEVLANGGVIGMPTETVYGLAGSIKSEKSIKNIFSIKERPFFDPLIVHVSSQAMAKSLVKEWPMLAEKLADAFWPGPLTIVLPKSNHVSDLITSGLESVGLRCPNHKLALELIETIGHGLAAPSANKFTKTSPTTAQHVKDEFNNEVIVLDGGPCEVGIESTVVGIEENTIKIYRPGKITRQDILELFSNNALIDASSEILVEYTSSPVAPGQLNHHYMPEAPVILCSESCAEKLQEKLNELDKKLTAKAVFWYVPKDPIIAARELYAKFRELSNEFPSSIIVQLDSSIIDIEQDCWRGIINRLTKAASYNLLSKDHS